MSAFHIVQRVMYEETIYVEAANESEARDKLARGLDCETVESEPCGDPEVVKVEGVDEVPGFVVQMCHGGTDVCVRNARVSDEADEIYETRDAAWKAALEIRPRTGRAYDFSET